MPSLSDTISAAKQGAQGASVSDSITNIEGWQDTLSGIGSPEAQAIVDDLESLKTELSADTIDGQAIGGLIARLGQQTMAIADSAGGANAGEIRELGQALLASAEAQGAPTA